MNCPLCNGVIGRIRGLFGKPRCPACGAAYKVRFRHKPLLLIMLLAAMIAAALSPFAPARTAFVLLEVGTSLAVVVGVWALMTAELKRTP
jgi:hypothetical protein